MFFFNSTVPLAFTFTSKNTTKQPRNLLQPVTCSDLLLNFYSFPSFLIPQQMPSISLPLLSAPPLFPFPCYLLLPHQHHVHYLEEPFFPPPISNIREAQNAFFFLYLLV
uniref:Uncharacterized protein n=1 Tax=Opuntia streptacantha TaxID=393608 RepID=A0A7C9F2J5_OPUST